MKQKEIINKLFEIINKYNNENNCKVVLYKQQQELKELLHLDSKEATKNWNDVFLWVEKYLKYSVNTNNSQFLNRMWAGATQASQIGEIITAITNTCSSTYDSAPVATVMEKYMIQTMLDEIGFYQGEGQMTTGSSNANMIAMMIARNEKSIQVKKQGLKNKKKLIAFVNEEAHYSFDNAANIIGIGTDNLVKIPCLENGEMNIDILEKEIEKTIKSKNIPFFVSSTAGTTVRGAYDNINKILKLRKKYNFWLHVDGAWGGIVFLNKKLREKFLTGIEKVDSFTFDFHKMTGINLICNMLLINKNKKKSYLKENCSIGDSSYIFNGKNDNTNFPYNMGEYSLQCGKRVDSLKLFLEWKYNGKKGISEKIEKYYFLAKIAEQLVNKSDYLELVSPRISFNICFRFTFSINISDLNLKLKNKLNKSGKSMVGGAYIKKNYCIRLLIANENINKNGLIIFFNNIIEIGKKIEALELNKN